METTMKIANAVFILGMIFLSCSATILSCNTRNVAYEEYCDSIYNADPDYYYDVLMETDEYNNYIEQNGEWWN